MREMGLQNTSRPFNELAEEYDSWFEDNPLFDIELKTLLATEENLPEPKLEIGVGPGRFAQALKVRYGIDLAISPLQLATRRSIIAINAAGENIPLLSASMGTVYVLFTLCFLTDPDRVLRECWRVIKPNGKLVIGMIPQLSEWGKLLSDKGNKGDPYYRHARFRTVAATKELLLHNGFEEIESWSTLFQSPGKPVEDETHRFGNNEHAGFYVLITHKKGK